MKKILRSHLLYWPFKVASPARVLSRSRLAEYNSIKIGDSRTRVADLVGSDGSETSSSGDIMYRSYEGYGSVGANAVIAFEKTKFLSKAQSGLK